MKISVKGIGMIKTFEGLRLRAYKCTAGKWTIGYGHTAGVKEGDIITQAQADMFLRNDLAWSEDCVNNSVKVELKQPMYDALVSLVFNIGAGAFEKSTILRKLNEKNYIGAADEFGRWVHSGGKVVNGLIERRKKEKDMFISEGFPDGKEAEKPVKNLPDLKGYSGVSIIEALQNAGYNSNFSYRKTIAKELKIKNYTGTSEQNLEMIRLLGGTVKDGIFNVSLKGYKGFSIVDGLKKFGYDSSYDYRKKLAKYYGISNYTGKSAENTKLLNILKSK